MVGNRHCEETKATKQSRGYGSPRRYAARDDGEGLLARDDGGRVPCDDGEGLSARDARLAEREWWCSTRLRQDGKPTEGFAVGQSCALRVALWSY